MIYHSCPWSAMKYHAPIQLGWSGHISPFSIYRLMLDHPPLNTIWKGKVMLAYWERTISNPRAECKLRSQGSACHPRFAMIRCTLILAGIQVLVTYPASCFKELHLCLPSQVQYCPETCRVLYQIDDDEYQTKSRSANQMYSTEFIKYIIFVRGTEVEQMEYPSS